MIQLLCEHDHILVCIDMYAYNSLSVHMQPLKYDPATVVNMIMDSFALICMPTILSLYVCSLLKCDPATVDEHNRGLVCNYNCLSLSMPSLKRDPAAVCEYDHGRVCIGIYAHNSLSICMPSLKCDPAAVANMIM